MSKPREWWINIFSGCVLEEDPDIWLKADPEIIKVIEYSAYKKLLEDNKRMALALEAYAEHECPEVIEHPSPFIGYVETIDESIIREALEAHEKTMGELE